MLAFHQAYCCQLERQSIEGVKAAKVIVRGCDHRCPRDVNVLSESQHQQTFVPPKNRPLNSGSLHLKLVVNACDCRCEWTCRPFGGATVLARSSRCRRRPAVSFSSRVSPCTQEVLAGQDQGSIRTPPKSCRLYVRSFLGINSSFHNLSAVPTPPIEINGLPDLLGGNQRS